MTTFRITAVLGLAVSLAGCAAASRGGGYDRTVITAEEIEAADVRNAYELIERLRPLWLQSRGERSGNLETTILVYQDQVPLGGIETLQNIPIEIIHSVRALDAAAAMRLPGLGSRHVERAIVIATRPGMQ